MSPTRRWVVALNPSGMVLGAEQGAPAGWLGSVLHEREGLPRALRDAARELSATALGRDRSLERREVLVEEFDAAVELVLVPAVGLRLRATKLRALLEHATAPLVRPARTSDVGLHLVVDPSVPESARLDPEKIAWAVSTLVGNALRYVKHGTRQMPGGSIKVAASVEHAELVLSVEDDGPGIAPDVLEQLFHHGGNGTPALGFALGLMRDIAEAHGGSLELTASTDDDDHGTTVVLRIPI